MYAKDQIAKAKEVLGLNLQQSNVPQEFQPVHAAPPKTYMDGFHKPQEQQQPVSSNPYDMY